MSNSAEKKKEEEAAKQLALQKEQLEANKLFLEANKLKLQEEQEMVAMRQAMGLGGLHAWGAPQ